MFFSSRDLKVSVLMNELESKTHRILNILAKIPHVIPHRQVGINVHVHVLLLMTICDLDNINILLTHCES